MSPAGRYYYITLAGTQSAGSKFLSEKCITAKSTKKFGKVIFAVSAGNRTRALVLSNTERYRVSYHSDKLKNPSELVFINIFLCHASGI